jgi:hypothetical protein
MLITFIHKLIKRIQEITCLEYLMFLAIIGLILIMFINPAKKFMDQPHYSIKENDNSYTCPCVPRK